MFFGPQSLSTGTAFLVGPALSPILVTNRHNVTGMGADGRCISSTGGVPDRIEIAHNVEGRLGNYVTKSEPLFDADGSPLWKEHPTYGERVDFVALRLTSLESVGFQGYDVEAFGHDIVVGPAETVSVIGFPFGLTVDRSLPVWATGFIASDIDVDVDDLPCFLIDCRTRPGQSGSPVIAYRLGGYRSSNAGLMVTPEPAIRFLGIYSGRINAESDIGRVWKAEAIRDLVRSMV